MATGRRSNEIIGREGNGRAQLEQARWEAVAARIREPGDSFVYAVVTTGVYCRSGCSSRLPDRKNVRYFDSPADAERAGFRACKRCAPDSADGGQAHREAIIRACRAIEESDSPLSLPALAAAAGLSPFHFQRVFKKSVGVTPRQYAIERRLGRVRAGLRHAATVTEGAYEAGYGSGSGLYGEAGPALGMTPSEYKNGAGGLRIRYAIAPSELGLVLVAATEKGICAVAFGDSRDALREFLESEFPLAEIASDDAGLGESVRQVTTLIESPGADLDLPLDIRGTAFQRRVWQALQQIPPGRTASYAEIAAGIGKPGAARAVGAACAANRIAVAIPCHRATRSDGTLSGYRWGVERKRELLDREASSRAAK
ncbi:MAG: bifunctional DNA-binding transcriptional regulator/O6-methylguanine-DNA methyltransferase Ada [Rudaea sp.]